MKPVPKTNIFIKIFLYLFGISLSFIGIITIMVLILYPKMPSMDELRNYQPKLPLKVYSSDGVLLGQFGLEHRIFVKFKNTPPNLVKAILAAEDERFYQHGGVDYIGVFRAIISNLLSFHKQSGASTITMQVARNFFLSSKKTYIRKFNEVLLAYKMESSLTKDQILELYINQIYLGWRAYGFAEASYTYFGKPINRLTIAEYAVLAGLPKAPSAYNPIVNKKRSNARKVYILNRMKDLNFISNDEYKEAISQEIIINKTNLKDATDAGSYVSEMVRQMLYDKFGESIYTAGYKVTTTIDSKMQLAAYNALRNGIINYDSTYGYNGAEADFSDQLLSGVSNNNINDDAVLSILDGIEDFGDLQAGIITYKTNNLIRVKLKNNSLIDFSVDKLRFVKRYLNSGGKKQLKVGSLIRVRNYNNNWTISQIPEAEGALVAINPNDGAIKALMGGFDFNKNKYNHVTQAYRQPGSGFKTFVYSAALEKGYNANTIIEDSSICFASGGENNGQWCPKNDESDNGFAGDVTLRYALTKSLNIPVIKIIDDITPNYVINYLAKFGFDTSVFHPYLTLSLGADGVTPLQMASAYAVFANGGYLVNPYVITEIADSHGKILAKTLPVNIKLNKPSIDPRNAFIMTSILSDVVKYGTGARVYKELGRLDLAGKTGTTNNNKDTWFNGFTPNLVAITWVGYDTPKSLGSHAYGASVAMPIWIDFMKSALANMSEMQRIMPSGIIVKHGTGDNPRDEYLYDPKYTADVVDTSTIKNTSVDNNIVSGVSLSDDLLPSKQIASTTNTNTTDNSVTNTNNADTTNNIGSNNNKDPLQDIINNN